jgi:hypothetical protein
LDIDKIVGRIADYRSKVWAGIRRMEDIKNGKIETGEVLFF